jgi:anti-sigma regulatory factor (Ser/Thr protein kinase)
MVTVVCDVLADFELPSQVGNEREAADRVAGAVEGLQLGAERLERLKTAVAEATLNAMEHGSGYRPDRPVGMRVGREAGRLLVQVSDRGGGQELPERDVPDIEAKLAGEQTPRGWGLFLIEKMVDEASITSDGEWRTLELVMALEGGVDGDS